MSGGIVAVERKILTVALAGLATGGRPAPGLAELYHNDPVPRDCDCDGLLYVHWPRYVPDRTQIPPGMAAPPGPPLVTLYARLFRCWPKMTSDGTKSGTDGAAEGLAADADVLWSAFTQAICALEFMDVTRGVDGLQLVDITPRPNLTCSGIQLQFIAAPRPWAPDEDDGP